MIMECQGVLNNKISALSLGLSDDKCLPDMLLDQLHHHSDGIAVIDEKQQLSYRELVDKSSNVSRYLDSLGVRPDDCVGIFTEPSVELMIGVWGILFSGSAYLPLSPEYPEERLQYMVDNSGIKIIFCQQHLQAKLKSLINEKTTIITLDDVAVFCTADSTNPDQSNSVRMDTNNLAYIIYTSGSTGKPKGVMIEHGSIVNQMNWLRTTFGFDGSSIVLQKTPMSFDAAQWEILAPCIGCTVVMGQPGIYRDPDVLIQTIIEYQVTSLQCVPTLLQALLNTSGWYACHSLKIIFSGGELLTKHLAEECLETLPSCKLINLYGPTECTINTFFHEVNRDTIAKGANSIAIGRPVINTNYYICDKQGTQVALGDIGELLIGGNQLARGYLNRPNLTNDAFIDNLFDQKSSASKLYRTGDLVSVNADGTVQFAGRIDNQVKLRGYRVELDEIRLAIEDHSWVKNAVMLIKKDPRTQFQNLIACIELNQSEAALMDQGNHGAHHQSKASKVQVKAQLSNSGCRDEAELQGKTEIQLPGKIANEVQRRKVFARKTYRFFEGGEVSQEDIMQLLLPAHQTETPRQLSELSYPQFSQILRYFGQFMSSERLLPKYGYASPGALYATQIYFELHHFGNLAAGLYYYHPVHHQLILITEVDEQADIQITLHFMGKKRAIEPVYKNNIQEVLEMEAGHMLGLFDDALATRGLGIGVGIFNPSVKSLLECATEDYYLGSFEWVSLSEVVQDESIDIYVQTHKNKVSGLPVGQYHYSHGEFKKISDELILMKHVIAINQRVYADASFGISMIRRDTNSWQHYISLGRKLQHMQMNDLNLGLMSSGYSSKTGHDLPSATRMMEILTSTDVDMSAFYFCIGGRISDEQRDSEGMKEDVVHMKGPVEIIKDDLLKSLPSYIVPNRIILIDSLPLTANGKVDSKALAESPEVNVEAENRPIIAPRTPTEERLGTIWKKAMKWEAVSVIDDFFESGGNSLIAVALIKDINKVFQCTLPLQILFESPTIEKLARKVDGRRDKPVSRLVRLAANSKPPIYCWPGLGGYPMNLRLLANQVEQVRPFYGVQAYGINSGETPFPTITKMASTDIKKLKLIQPSGPYTLWGYSFGARVAFEVAYQLEQAGESVEKLVLIAPGSPKLQTQIESQCNRDSNFDNAAFVTILYSVFAHSITGSTLQDCLKVVTDLASFVEFICSRYRSLDADLVQRITQIVRQTYEFEYSFSELNERRLNAPITICKACGDDYSFLDGSDGYSLLPPTVIELQSDHYSLLKAAGIKELLSNFQELSPALQVNYGATILENASGGTLDAAH